MQYPVFWKRMAWIVLISCCWGNAQGQSTVVYTYSENIDRNLIEVLDQLKDNYQIDFSYPSRVLEKIQIPPCKIAADDLESFIRQLLRNTALDFTLLNDRQVLLRKTLYFQSDQAPDEFLATGKVVDAISRAPLEAVAVYLDTLNLGVVTDEKGHFSFTLPAYLKDRPVYFQQLGYDQLKVSAADLSSEPIITMQTAVLPLQEVTVTERLPVLKAGPTSPSMELNVGDLTRFNPSNVGAPDIFRTIQLLPGVSAHDDLSAEVKIRGSEDDATLVLLDGIPIYRAEHFYGIFSAVNNSYLSSAQLYKNTIPVAYGGKTGGMLLLQSGAGSPDLGGEIDAGLLTTSMSAAIPVSSRTALFVGGRTSYGNPASSGLFSALGRSSEYDRDNGQDFSRRALLEIEPAFRFYDLNGKLLIRPGKEQLLDINFFYSDDQLLSEYSNRFFTRSILGRGRIENEEYYFNQENWSNTGMGANYSYALRTELSFKASVFFSEYAGTGAIESSLARAAENEQVNWSFANRQQNRMSDLGLRMSLEHQIEKNYRLEYGLEVVRHDNRFELLEENQTRLFSSSDAWQGSLFGAYQWLNKDRWSADLGVRATYYGPTGKLYLSPQLQWNFQLGKNWSAKTAWSRHYQFVRELTHENRLGQNLEFFILSDEAHYPVGQSDNYMLGLNFKQSYLSVDLEAYYRDFDGVLEHAQLFTGFDSDEVLPPLQRQYKLFTGTGNTLGLDVLLSYDRGNYSGWLSYTLSKTTHRFKEIFRNGAIPSQDDRRHQLSLVNTYRLGKWQFSGNYVFASGRPYTNLAGLTAPQDRRELAPSLRLKRLPAYHRLDLGVNYLIPVRTTELQLGLSIYNLTNRENVKYLQYIYSVPYEAPNGNRRTVNQLIGTSTNLLDRTININLNWKF